MVSATLSQKLQLDHPKKGQNPATNEWLEAGIQSTKCAKKGNPMNIVEGQNLPKDGFLGL